ncbi:VOC family protein [Defluviimonas sp. SAOS-178_SWC]|uniref:VOC family protein n=1 Tax=Defluviimonas sp. SAOS-178_SWC TaxID=3121287 RepID=UPI0032213F0E
MAKTRKGTPCWYELATTDPTGAAAFYGHVLGWTTADAGMPGFDYRLASSGDDMVAGITPGSPPAWIFYVTVTDCGKAAKAVVKAGGAILNGPMEVPGTGTVAILADPQGARFGILAPLDDAGRAFDQKQAGHGNWHELMTSDPAAAMAFYGKEFGWKPSRSMDMGAMGSYDIFNHAKADIGGMMRQAPGMPGPGHPFWVPYFGCDSVEAAMARVTAGGGRVFMGPQEVPGGAVIMVGQDPLGAIFALVGPR